MLPTVALANQIARIQRVTYEDPRVFALDCVNAFMTASAAGFQTITDYNYYIKELQVCKDALLELDPNQPILINALHAAYSNKNVLGFNDIYKFHQFLDKRYIEIKTRFDQSMIDLPEIAFQKIRECESVFVYGFTPELLATLFEIFKKNHKCNIMISECRPSEAGKKLIASLPLEMHMTYYTESAMRQAIKQADIVIMGCDKIDKNINFQHVIGSELVAELAQRYSVPVYVICDSWKYHAKLTLLDSDQMPDPSFVWEQKPENVTVYTFQYEKILPRLIQGIICERGIFEPKTFATKLKFEYPDTF